MFTAPTDLNEKLDASSRPLLGCRMGAAPSLMPSPACELLVFHLSEACRRSNGSLRVPAVRFTAGRHWKRGLRSGCRQPLHGGSVGP